MGKRRTLPPGAKWITLPSGAKRVELVLDGGFDSATGKRLQIKRRYKTVDEATDGYTDLKSEVRKGTFVQPSKRTVEEVLCAWLEGRISIRNTTLTGYRDALKPIRALYGHMPLQQFGKEHILEAIALLRVGGVKRADGRQNRPWGPRTVNLMLFVLTSALDDAVDQGYIARNVAALVDRIPQKRVEMKTYSAEEVDQLLTAASSDRLQVVYRLALYGLRRGEIAGLRWSNVDLDNSTLKVELSRVSVDGQAEESDPKSFKSFRVLPTTPVLDDALRRLRKLQQVEQEKAGDCYRASGFVVVNELGQPLHPETLSDKWEKLITVAKVKRIRLHDARHTCATLMNLEGVDIATISQWLGHADPAFTLRTYVHSQPKGLANAAKVLGSVTSV